MAEQAANEARYRQLLMQGVLALLLPSEDLGNACVRTLVADVLADMILGGAVGGKACEGWVVWEGIAKAVAAGVNTQGRGADGGKGGGRKSRLERFGLVGGGGGGGDDSAQEDAESRRRGKRSRASDLFWKLLQGMFFAFVALRFVVLGLIAARAVAPSSSPIGVGSRSLKRRSSIARRDDDAPRKQSAPLLRYRFFSLVATLTEMRERTPWLSGGLKLVQWQLTSRDGWLAGRDGLLDR
jgi:hypothetical protein